MVKNESNERLAFPFRDWNLRPRLLQEQCAAKV